MECKIGWRLVVVLLVLLVGLDLTLSEEAAKPKIPKIKTPVQKTPNTLIDDVPGDSLVHLVDEHEHVAVLFYNSLDKQTKKALSEMEGMETEDLDVEIVRIHDDAVAQEYEVDVTKLPVLVF